MDGTAWAMAAHIVALGVWSAALLILAGLYASAPGPVNADSVPADHDAAPPTQGESHRHSVMCRYVFVMLASPAAILTIISGTALVALLGVSGSWLLAKLALVAMLAVYHTYCGHLLHVQGMETRPSRPSPWRRPLLILVPVTLICLILILVLGKPDVVLEYKVAPQPAGYRHEQSPQQGQIQSTAVDGSQWVFQTG